LDTSYKLAPVWGNLVNNVVRQVRQRLGNLPKGTKQIVTIDVRGQNVNQAT